MTKTYKIKGMDCPSCATLLECELEDVGIKAKISFPKETLETEESSKEELIHEVINKAGYNLTK